MSYETFSKVDQLYILQLFIVGKYDLTNKREG
jgi:hypothetical protein